MSPAPDSRADDAWTAAIVAAALRRGAMIHRLSMAITAATLLVFFIAGGLVMKLTVASAVAALVLLCGVAEFWLATRVAFDADLFDALARSAGDCAGLDRAMAALGLIPASKQGRTMAARAAGALRLLKLQGLACAAQLVIALSGGLAIAARLA